MIAYVVAGVLILAAYLAIQEITDRFDGRGKR